jgi:hypothetical protein
MADEELRARLRRIEASVLVIEFVVVQAVWIGLTVHFAHRLIDDYHWSESSAALAACSGVLAIIIAFVCIIRWALSAD